jgi:exopolysaccharide production protein ExoZ
MTLPKHMPALDGLRGVAILMVVMKHVSDGWASALAIYPGDHIAAASFALPAALRAIAYGTENGVMLFFVISAFTLTIRAAQDEGDLRSYALRRLARVGPGYWLAGLAYTLAGGLAPRLWAPDGISLSDLVIAAVFGSAWTGGASLAVVPGGWSVACEVAFYIALPGLIRLIDGRIWRSVTLAMLAMVIAQLHARHALAAGTFSFASYVSPVEQAPVFLCGVTAALIAMRFRLSPRPMAPILLLAYAIVALPVLPIPWSLLMPHLVFAPVVAMAVALAAVSSPALLASRAMRRIGELSYSMYLVHFVLLAISLRMAEWLVPAMDERTLVLHFGFTLAGSVALASITFRCIERPAIGWAARRSRRPQVAALSSVQA